MSVGGSTLENDPEGQRGRIIDTLESLSEREDCGGKEVTVRVSRVAWLDHQYNTPISSIAYSIADTTRLSRRFLFATYLCSTLRCGLIGRTRDGCLKMGV